MGSPGWPCAGGRLARPPCCWYHVFNPSEAAEGLGEAAQGPGVPPRLPRHLLLVSPPQPHPGGQGRVPEAGASPRRPDPQNGRQGRRNIWNRGRERRENGRQRDDVMGGVASQSVPSTGRVPARRSPSRALRPPGASGHTALAGHPPRVTPGSPGVPRGGRETWGRARPALGLQSQQPDVGDGPGAVVAADLTRGTPRRPLAPGRARSQAMELGGGPGGKKKETFL